MKTPLTEAATIARGIAVAKVNNKAPMPWREVYTVDTVGEAVHRAVCENA